MSQALASMIKMNSEQPLLLLRMEPLSDLLGDQGGVAAGAVVDNEVHLDLVFYSLVHDLNGIFDHLPGQDTVLVKEQFNLVNNVPDPTRKSCPKARSLFPFFSLSQANPIEPTSQFPNPAC